MSFKNRESKLKCSYYYLSESLHLLIFFYKYKHLFTLVIPPYASFIPEINLIHFSYRDSIDTKSSIFSMKIDILANLKVSNGQITNLFMKILNLLLTDNIRKIMLNVLRSNNYHNLKIKRGETTTYSLLNVQFYSLKIYIFIFFACLQKQWNKNNSQKSVSGSEREG